MLIKPVNIEDFMQLSRERRRDVVGYSRKGFRVS